MNHLNVHDESTQQDAVTGLRNLLSAMPDIEFSVIVGSRAEGKARAESDWDIALQWQAGFDWMAILSKTETLRRKMADVIGVTPDKIDLIELRRANLAMCANVAESGLPLTGENTLAWAHFLNRTWRELEDFYWEKNHAA